MAPARGAIATALVVAAGILLIGTALYHLLREPAFAPPPYERIVLEQRAAVRSPAGWIVPVEVRNPADEPLAHVRVIGELYDGARRVETAEAVVAVLPPGSGQRVALVFRTAPTGKRLDLRAVGPEAR